MFLEVETELSIIKHRLETEFEFPLIRLEHLKENIFLGYYPFEVPKQMMKNIIALITAEFEDRLIFFTMRQTPERQWCFTFVMKKAELKNAFKETTCAAF